MVIRDLYESNLGRHRQIDNFEGESYDSSVHNFGLWQKKDIQKEYAGIIIYNAWH